MKNDQSCMNCKFSTAASLANVKERLCRRNPPTPLLGPGPNGQPIIVAQHVSVQAGNWCGEWSAKLAVEVV